MRVCQHNTAAHTPHKQQPQVSAAAPTHLLHHALHRLQPDVEHVGVCWEGAVPAAVAGGPVINAQALKLGVLHIAHAILMLPPTYRAGEGGGAVYSTLLTP